MSSSQSGFAASVALFAVGALFGTVLGFFLFVAEQQPVRFFGGIALTALAGGFFSARYGVRFWESLRHFFWWVP